MLNQIKSEYVFFWIEDHICLSGVNYFNQVVAEMKILDAEYLLYSAFHQGETLDSYNGIPLFDSGAIIQVNYDATRHLQRIEFVKSNKLICATFIISCCSILSNKLFKKVVLTKDPIINRWPKETPFDFEKNERDTHWLPMKVAQTKQEFFAFIDDDHGRTGYSLIGRGLYPNRVSRESILKVRKSYLKIMPPLFVIHWYVSLREKINVLFAKIQK
jgi:hypothetical protein